MDINQLRAIMPKAGNKAVIYLPWLNGAMNEEFIIGKDRQASFLSQIAQESLQLTFTQELASGAGYEGRHDLGNTQPGDGVRFKGRGLIQITGRDNYVQCSDYFNIPLAQLGDWLEAPEGAARSAAWWWRAHGCNQLADKGDQVAVTKRVNGGTNGLANRLAYFAVAQKVLA